MSLLNCRVRHSCYQLTPDQQRQFFVPPVNTAMRRTHSTCLSHYLDGFHSPLLASPQAFPLTPTHCLQNKISQSRNGAAIHCMQAICYSNACHMILPDIERERERGGGGRRSRLSQVAGGSLNAHLFPSPKTLNPVWGEWV